MYQSLKNRKKAVMMKMIKTAFAFIVSNLWGIQSLKKSEFCTICKKWAHEAYTNGDFLFICLYDNRVS